MKSASGLGIVTGSRKGLGRAMTEHLLNGGYRIVGCSRAPSDLRHPNYRHFALDVADENAVEQMFNELSSMGPLSFCVNNAGSAALNHFLLTPPRQARRIFETNLFGSFVVAQNAARAMIPHGGKIINMSSVAVAMNLEGEAAYVASKAGIESLTRVLAKELLPNGISVNAIAPGPIDTDLIRGIEQTKIKIILEKTGRTHLTTFQEVLSVLDSILIGSNSSASGQIFKV